MREVGLATGEHEEIGPWGYDANLFTLYYANRIGIVFNNRAQRVRKNIGSALMYGVSLFPMTSLLIAKVDGNRLLGLIQLLQVLITSKVMFPMSR